ncbi:MAG: 3-oxoacyl-ACP synthase III [Planctomycetota bacterium]
MRFSRVCIESLGYHLPGRTVSSSEIEESLRPLYERLRLPFGRLELMTGVRERRFFDAGTKPSDIATEAGKKALAASGVPRSRIGALFHTSVCRDFVEPATASVVHNGLDLPPACMIFDLSNACLGFLNGMVMLGNMIEAGQVEAGLLVSGECGRDLVESTIRELNENPAIDRRKVKRAFASLTIGSAGVAAVLCHEKFATDPSRRRLRGGVVRCATAHNDLCQGGDTSNGHGTLMETDSEELLRQGVELASETWRAMCQDMQWQPDGTAIERNGHEPVPPRFIGHQVGTAHRRALFDRLGLDSTREFSTFDRLGNVGSAAAPITLALADEAGFLPAGEPVAMLGIGSGINCLMLAVDW